MNYDPYDLVVHTKVRAANASIGLEVEECRYTYEDSWPEQYAVTVTAFENNHRTEVHFLSDAGQFVEEDIRQQWADFLKFRDAVDSAFRSFRQHVLEVTLPELKQDDF